MSMIECQIEVLEELFRDAEQLLVRSNIEEIKRGLRHLKQSMFQAPTNEKKLANEKLKEFDSRLKKLQHSMDHREFACKELRSKTTSSTDNHQSSLAQDSLVILIGANKQLHQTEQLAQETLIEINRQGEIIEAQRKAMQQVNDSLSHSNRLLNKMRAWWKR